MDRIGQKGMGGPLQGVFGLLISPGYEDGWVGMGDMGRYAWLLCSGKTAKLKDAAREGGVVFK